MGFNRSVVHGFYDPVDTERKLNVHMTFRRRPGRLLNVLCTFNLRPVYGRRAEAKHTKSSLYYMKDLINLHSILPVNDTIFTFQKRDSATFKPQNL